MTRIPLMSTNIFCGLMDAMWQTAGMLFDTDSFMG